MYRLSNHKDLECVLYEVAGTVGRKELLDMYTIATREAYSFLCVNLVSPKINDIFYINVNQKLQLSDKQMLN